MKYVVVPPEGYKAKGGEVFEFSTHKEAIVCALAISKICSKGVEIQRLPTPYKTKEVVVNI